MKFFEMLQKLFPRSRFFNSVQETNFRKFLLSIAALPKFLVEEAQKVFLDIFPISTKQIEKWEKIFGVEFLEGLDTEEKKRNVLKALWISERGQGAGQLEKILRLAIGELVIVENVPCRVPKGISMAYISVCGRKTMCCGNAKACCGAYIGTGMNPTIIKNNITEEYDIPDLPKYWSQCFFVCKEVRRDAESHEINYVEPLEVDLMWKKFLEFMILKMKPAQTTALMFVKYL